MLFDIRDNSRVEFKGVHFHNGYKEGPVQGGCVRVDNSTLAVRRSSFSHCTLRQTEYGQSHYGALGGALFASKSTVRLDKVEFSSNGVHMSNGGEAIQYHYARSDINGGAAFFRGCNVSVEDTAFEENVVSGSGGALFVEECQTLIRNSTFVLNAAKISGGALTQVGGVVAIERSSFTCNFAVDASGAGGGAFFIEQNAVVRVHGSTRFLNNYAASRGGAVALVCVLRMRPDASVCALHRHRRCPKPHHQPSSSTTIPLLPRTSRSSTVRVTLR